MSSPLRSCSLQPPPWQPPQINANDQKAMQELALNFLSSGNIDVQNADGETLLFLAVKTNHIALASNLIRFRADVDLDNAAGLTPLQLAAGRKDGLKMCQLLVGAGADVDKPGALGETPIHRALDHACTENAEYLISVGANMNARDCWGPTACAKLNALNARRLKKLHESLKRVLS